jgi:putative transposase
MRPRTDSACRLAIRSGRSRQVDLRYIVGVEFYIIRTSCKWHILLGDLPPKSTAGRYHDGWQPKGTLDLIHDMLDRRACTAEKPAAPTPSASVDSQSVDTTSGGKQRSHENAENVDGRRRHAVVDC